MAKINEKQLNEILEDANKGEGGVPSVEPAFQRYQKSWLRDINYAHLNRYRPEELVKAARTHEELLLVGKYLHNTYGNDHPWWNYYHKRRVDLAKLPSLYGTEDLADGRQRGLWGTPVRPQEYLRQSKGSQVQRVAVDRRLFPQLATWEQITGQKPLFKTINTGTGFKLERWKTIRTPKLPSNIPANAIIFDLETTGLLDQGSEILSLGYHQSRAGRALSSGGMYATFTRRKTYAEAIEKTILPQYFAAVKNKTTIPERDLVRNFISMMRSQGDFALVGYNIKGFDIPMLREAAKRHGLLGEFEKAVRKSVVVDVAEIAQSFLSKQLGGNVIGWQDGQIGNKPLGWQLEAVAKALGWQSTAKAHEAKVDVQMTKYVWNTLQDEEKAKKLFNYNILKDAVKKSTGRELLEVAPNMGTVNYGFQMMRSESQYLKKFTEHLNDIYPEKIPTEARVIGNAASEAQLGKKISGMEFKKPKALFDKLKGKPYLGKALGFSASIVGASLLFPGDFWRNAISAVGFEVGRNIAKRSGYGGARSILAGLAVNLGVSAAWYGLGIGQRANSELTAKEVLVNKGFEFSGHDDTWNTIEGLKDTGLKQWQRKSLTEFGSGYQGPNPWLNPEYNKAEDVPRYSTMRASKLGVAEEELYKYYTEKSKPSEYLEASAIAGTALHLLEESKALRSGKAANIEEFLYDPETGISGHADVIYPFGAPGDIKTLSSKRFAQLKREGPFSKHIHQLNWYMNQKNSQVGYLEYINRNDTKQKMSFEVSFDPKMLENDINKIRRVQNRVKAELEAGKLAEEDLPKTASIERLQSAAIQEQAQIEDLADDIPYLRKVFGEEMDYLNSVADRQRKDRIRRRKEAQGNLYLTDGEQFSGRDDDYNTIESLRHGGFAEQNRKTFTDFGSGFQILSTWFQNEAVTETRKTIFQAPQKKYTVDKTKNSFSGRDDSYNTTEGLRHDGLAQDLRKTLTEFGSGWDPLRKVAKEIYKEAGDDAFKKLVGSKEFKSALSEAKPLREIGEGWFGKATLMESTIKGKPFQFVRKTGEIGKQEASAMRAAQETITPSVYSETENVVDMEFFKGKTFSALEAEKAKGLETEVVKTFEKLHKAGYGHGDPNLGNIFLAETPEGKRVGLLDLGAAKVLTNDRAAKEDIEYARKFINSLGEESQITQVDPFAQVENIAPRDVLNQLQKPSDPFAQTENIATKDILSKLEPFGESKQTQATQTDEFIFDILEDPHNNVSTLNEPGIAKEIRKKTTDFGSGVNLNKLKIKSIFRKTPRIGHDYDSTINTLMADVLSRRGTKEDIVRNVKLPKHKPGANIPGMPEITGDLKPVDMKFVHNKPNTTPIGSSLGEEMSDSLENTRTLKSFTMDEIVPKDVVSSSIRDLPDPLREDPSRNARMRRFRQSATRAVGLGHRAAYKAGRKHTSFRSTQSV